MSKQRRIAVNRGDFDRVVLTETLPVEVPIVMSNSGFYDWLHTHLPELAASTEPAAIEAGRLVETLIFSRKKNADECDLSGCKSTRAMIYSTSVDSKRTRQLFLVHPRSQALWIRFYKRYHTLIVRSCQRSKSSLRAPIRIAGHVFVPNSEDLSNVYRLQKEDFANVDGVKNDKNIRHASSFFAYRGVQRLHRFMDSDNFIALEKKFSVMWILDVANCFGSIYTHSISWALKSKIFVKSNNGDKGSFGDVFDEFMAHGNWKETHGIVVGPEISRIFAEIIFQAIDDGALKNLKKVSFELRRYVDDYFLFAESDDAAAVVVAELERRLAEYKFVFNHAKTERYRRPFLTPRSSALDEVRTVCRNSKQG